MKDMSWPDFIAAVGILIIAFLIAAPLIPLINFLEKRNVAFSQLKQGVSLGELCGKWKNQRQVLAGV